MSANGSTPSGAREIKADIERTRAELAETVDALAAKLDVKAQARHRAHEAATQATEAVDRARAAAPAPVQQALDTIEEFSRPALAKAAEDKQRTALVLGGALLALLILRRTRRPS